MTPDPLPASPPSPQISVFWILRTPTTESDTRLTIFVTTNHHVIEGATEIEISLKDGSRVPAELIGSDRLMDLAVLKVKSDKIKSAAQCLSQQAPPFPCLK
jgi:small nuclear ribonucleoprotein (snRNP)-like protein